MTTEPIIVSADATVAEGLALIRRHELHPRSAPRSASRCRRTSRRPAASSAWCTSSGCCATRRTSASARCSTTTPRAGARATRPPPRSSRILASYNLVSVPVVDESHRLVGVVTIDDVLDYLLPDDWRSRTTTTTACRDAGATTPTTAASRIRPEGGRRWHAS